MTNASDPDDDDLIAAEYVLGVLDLPARVAAEARIKADPHFAESVAAWENRLSGMNDGFAPVPAPDLLPQIEARLFPKPNPVVKGRRLWLWFAAPTLAVALLFAVFVPFATDPVMTPLTTLTAEATDLRFDATQIDNTLVLARVAGGAPAAGHSHEAWLIIGDAAPLSLGVVGDAGLTLPLPALPAGAVLAITLEPAGGSPSGAPTGPVLVSGSI